MTGMNRRKAGQSVTLFGFLLVLLGAADYFFRWNSISSAVWVIGLMLAAVGMFAAKRKG